MAEDWAQPLTRWIDAGILDEATAGRIRAFEQEQQAGPSRLRWPVWIALAFGALMLGAGVLLFVSANWDQLSPLSRFALVALLVAVFHMAAAATADRFPSMATTLHVVGTVALGAGIFLAGQIFNLDEHWPGGIMLWALGAAIAWALLRSAAQMALVAILAPAWLTSEWFVATGDRFYADGAHVATAGVALLALSYFTACRPGRAETGRRILLCLGAVGLPLAAIALVFASGQTTTSQLSTVTRVLGWSVAIGAPLLVAIIFRRQAAWPNVLAAIWVLVLLRLHPAADLYQYIWWATGATGLAAWGVSDARSERINMGAVIFAVTILTFYFSQVMDKLGRSASLVGLGVLFLAGGWMLERVRRHLVLQTQRRHA
jgi:hypothetical protein